MNRILKESTRAYGGAKQRPDRIGPETSGTVFSEFGIVFLSRTVASSLHPRLSRISPRPACPRFSRLEYLPFLSSHPTV